MKTDELREKYLEFFKSKGHTVCPSDVMVPKWDKTVLFTPAGMNQFKDHFLGKVELEFTRATTAQKCLRTGDIENVGRTAYHHTFFEMLGNFSFGDYFKREAIHWAWEFLTQPAWLNMEADRLSVTVYLDDDEAYRIWNEEIGLPGNRIKRMDEHDNFWPAGAPTLGPDGVCGPCSEIFFQPDNGPECEIWNLVFTQFNRIGDPPDNLHPLPSNNIDTGMGLERTAATLQGVSTNFHIDTLLPIVEAAAEVCGVKYDPASDNGRRLRRITDHVRAVSLAIHENVYPGSQKEESVVRLLLRRAVLQGYEMGLRDPFLYQLVPVVVDQLKAPYPELTDSVERVASVIKAQELDFYSLVDRAIPLIESIVQLAVESGSKKIDAVKVAEAYQSRGVPATIAESVAEQHGLQFDWAEFEAAMERHAKVSGTDEMGVMGDVGPIDDLKRELKTTRFLGYDSTEQVCRIRGLVEESRAADVSGSVDQMRSNTLRKSQGRQLVFLDQTPFYAESGGQVGDSGWIIGPTGRFQVDDTQKDGDVIIHYGQVVEGALNDGDTVSAVVDASRRDAIRRAHTATHVLHHALQQNLGRHAQQRGSRVADDHLRFDFANLDAVPEDVLVAIETESIQHISENAPVTARTLPLEEARKQGAMMLFGEKYPDPVRMVSVGDFSKELCGGIHVGQAGDIGCFEIVIEENLGSGTRRIQALTGARAEAERDRNQEDVVAICERLQVEPEQFQSAVIRLNERVKSLKKQLAAGSRSSSDRDLPEIRRVSFQSDPPSYFELRTRLRETAQALNVSPRDVISRVDQMRLEVDHLTQELDQLANIAEINADDLIEAATQVGDVRVIAATLPVANPGVMRQLIDQIRKKANPVAVVLAAQSGPEKVLLAAAFSRDLVDRGYHAGNWIKELAPLVGGRGGGKPDMAQAGGDNPGGLPEVLQAAVDSVARMAN